MQIFNSDKGRASVKYNVHVGWEREENQAKIVNILSTIDIYLNRYSVITKSHKVLLLKMNNILIESR